LRTLLARERCHFAKGRSRTALIAALFREDRASAILEFAISLPLLVIFVVGIFDFSGAFDQKQKIEQAAQQGAIIAGAQPTSDIAATNGSPTSLQSVVTAVFNSLAGSGMLPNANQAGGTCGPPFTPSSQSGLAWTYSVTGCSNNPPGAAGCFGDTSDTLYIKIDRGWVPPPLANPPPNQPTIVGTAVTVSYDYDWTFNRVIQLLVPGAGYSARSCLNETSNVQNQM
jgi:Flp pilus assembly protein TadG